MNKMSIIIIIIIIIVVVVNQGRTAEIRAARLDCLVELESKCRQIIIICSLSSSAQIQDLSVQRDSSLPFPFF